MNSSNTNTLITGAILAGGEGRRMLGANKPLCKLKDQTLLDRVRQKLKPQVSSIYLSINDELNKSHLSDFILVPDLWNQRLGPLAGIYAVMKQLKEDKADAQWLLCSPVDCPFIPTNLCQQLQSACKNSHASIAYARSKGRNHYLSSLWSLDTIDALELAINEERLAVRKLIQALNGVAVEFNSPANEPDPFLNINSPEELAQAEWQLHHTSV
ncbi:molybdenum cofactor guanylyltransferase MobA [Agaribacterium sp. ZY112]|uniref:molybdenum cofactor guanylyltransferase MobA n=1 Tax=Agaribacterium sp. ZY112 TaxID=3233574 RepID=UPI003525EBCE